MIEVAPYAVIGAGFGAVSPPALSIWVTERGDLRWGSALVGSLLVGALVGALLGAVATRHGPLQIRSRSWRVPVLICTALTAALAAALVLGVVTALAMVLGVAIAAALQRSRARARAGSVLAAWNGRRSWLWTLTLVGVWASYSSAVDGRIAAALVTGGFAVLGAVAILAAARLDLVKLERAARDARLEFDAGVESGAAPLWDLGLGDETWWCTNSIESSYRASARPTLVLRGALAQTLQTLRRGFTIGIGLVVASAGALLHSGVRLWLDRSTAEHGTLQGVVCLLPPGTSRLSEGAPCNPVAILHTDALDVPTRSYLSGYPGVRDRVEWFAIDFTGKFSVSRQGNHGFRLFSDDGSILWIDGVRVIDHDGIHPPESKSGWITLGPGEHTIRVQYFQGPANHIALQLFVTPPGGCERLWYADLRQHGRTASVCC